MTAPREILGLIERYDAQREAYQSGQYKETEIRVEFIDPFFKALGWDVHNEQGYAEAYKDVIHEEALKIGGATEAPDCCFRIGGGRKFFVECKKPSVNIKDAPHPAYQLRRYGWSAKLPLSILTDFEEFAVYDCRVKPGKNDSSAVGRVLYLTSGQYAEKWEEIAAIFSREAVLKGSFDRFAESAKGKRGTTTVDDAFLEEIERWRDMLARNIAMRNPELSQRELNFAVQRTIDRIIFLRICEDRGIETYGRLMTLRNGERVYPRLCEFFQRADERYNSGLFHFEKEKDRPESPDELTLKLNLDDKVLKDILGNLYYPESPYEFSVLSADILGQVYERFLGKVIRLTAGHQAKVEEKPEVRKAGGVYYTPTYIVDYIVKNTVGKLIEEIVSRKGLPAPHACVRQAGARTQRETALKDIAKLRILDPACGSGSFLLGAYQYLLDWHLQYYTANEPESWMKGRNVRIYQAGSHSLTPGTRNLTPCLRLTTDEKKRILLNNIYGVDIDSQAVEVTKLSLLLKVLEGESQESITNQFELFHQRALPDLARNIKCGNSLIGSDFTAQSQLRIMSDEDREHINPFDWKQDGFPDIFKAGGFDVVVGNPPYVRVQGYPADQINYLTTHYRSVTGNCDLYVSFVERSFCLLRDGGMLGIIVPNKFFRTDYGEGLRRLLSGQKAVFRIVDFGAHQVFAATTYTCLLFLQYGGTDSFQYAASKATPEALCSAVFSQRDYKKLSSAAWTFENQETSSLLAKLQIGTKRLLDLPADMSRGSSTGDDDVFVFEAGTLRIEESIVREPLFASDFGRYAFAPAGKWKVIFPYVSDDDGYRLYTEMELKSKFPRAFAHLHGNQAILKCRKQYREWFGYSAPRNLELHDNAHIAVPLLADRGLFAMIPDQTRGRLCPMASGGFTITLSEQCQLRQEYVLGLLNSKLLFWRLRTLSNLFRGGWITCTKQYFGELPIRAIDFSNPTDKFRHDQMVTLVEQMLELHRKLPVVKTPQEKIALERHIAATDAQIDRLVFELYRLTEEEIRIVEGDN